MPCTPSRLPDCAPDPGTPVRPLRDLTGFADLVLGADGFTPAQHHRLLITQLEAVADGTIDRLMVLMPPGSAKSTYCSVLFPIWFLTRHPASSIIAAAHTADLAKHFARQARALITEHTANLGYRLPAAERAAWHWRTSARGQYYATGVRGPVAGRRADLAIIDDPVRSLLDAESARLRDQLWDWYCADLVTRLKPGGRVVLVMTRWHPDDLAGRLLEHNPDEWTVLRLPALAEVDDPMGRLAGAALWPDWEDEAALLRKRAQVGERMWQALYQQSPRPAGGHMLKPTRIEVLDGAPDPTGGMLARGWDLAATPENGRNDPDWTVGVKLLRDAAGRYIVLDVRRQRTTAFEVEETLMRVTREDGRSVHVSLPEDPGQAGKSQAGYYIRRLAGYRVVSSRETGSKSVRALNIATQMEAGNVALVRASWNQAFLEELRDFPYGRKDDQVDALARAFKLVSEEPVTTRRIALPLMAR